MSTCSTGGWYVLAASARRPHAGSNVQVGTFDLLLPEFSVLRQNVA